MSEETDQNHKCLKEKEMEDLQLKMSHSFKQFEEVRNSLQSIFNQMFTYNTALLDLQRQQINSTKEFKNITSNLNDSIEDIDKPEKDDEEDSFISTKFMKKLLLITVTIASIGIGIGFIMLIIFKFEVFLSAMSKILGF